MTIRPCDFVIGKQMHVALFRKDATSIEEVYHDRFMVEVNNKKIVLEFWNPHVYYHDDEPIKNILPIYVYNTSSRQSFDGIKRLLQGQNNKNPVKLLVGDLKNADPKVISTEEGHLLSKENGCKNFAELDLSIEENMNQLLIKTVALAFEAIESANDRR